MGRGVRVRVGWDGESEGGRARRGTLTPDLTRGSKAPLRVLWVSRVVDRHGIHTGLTLLPSWALRRSAFSSPEGLLRAVCREQGLFPRRESVSRSNIQTTGALPQAIRTPTWEGSDGDPKCVPVTDSPETVSSGDFRAGRYGGAGGGAHKHSDQSTGLTVIYHILALS